MKPSAIAIGESIVGGTGVTVSTGLGSNVCLSMVCDHDSFNGSHALKLAPSKVRYTPLNTLDWDKPEAATSCTKAASTCARSDARDCTQKSSFSSSCATTASGAFSSSTVEGKAVSAVRY